LLQVLRRRGRTQLAVPAYLCESLLQAADGSHEFTFLPVDAQLAPRAAAIEEFGRTAGEQGVLALVAPFGFALPGAVLEASAVAAQCGVLLLEDRSHSLFSPPAQVGVQRGFASLRKWAAVPDGGVLFGPEAARASRPQSPGGTIFSLRRDAMLIKGSWLRDPVGPKSAFLQPLRRAEQALDEFTGLRPMDPLSEVLFSRLNVPELIFRRRLNYRLLLDGLRSLPGIRAVFPQLPPSICPLGMVVDCDDRDGLRAALTAQRIFCPVHWPLPAAVTEGAFPEEHRLARRLLTLPCDQRYELRDMERLLSVLRGALR
jgi:hypothetical protein